MTPADEPEVETPGLQARLRAEAAAHAARLAERRGPQPATAPRPTDSDPSTREDHG